LRRFLSIALGALALAVAGMQIAISVAGLNLMSQILVTVAFWKFILNRWRSFRRASS